MTTFIMIGWLLVFGAAVGVSILSLKEGSIYQSFILMLGAILVLSVIYNRLRNSLEKRFEASQ